MDLKELNELVENILINKIDHKNLNMDVDFLKDINPTTENLVMKFWEQIECKIKNKTGSCTRLSFLKPKKILWNTKDKYNE